MATTSVKPNVKVLVDPAGKEYQFPIGWKFFNLDAPPGWSSKGQIYVQGGVTAPPLATLYGPGDAPLVVAVGSTYSHDMLAKGYSLDKGKYADPAAAAQSQKDKANAAPIPIPETWKSDGGTYALIRFKDDPTPNDAIDDTKTVWLLDTQSKTYRPIAGPSALVALAAQMGVPSLPITDVPSSVIDDPTNPFFQGEFLSTDFSITADQVNSKNVTPIPEKYQNSSSSSSETPVDQAKGTVYGKQRYGTAEETSAATTLVSFLNFLASGDPQNQYIKKETLDRIVNDPNSTFAAEAFLAVTYGGYTLGDVYRELYAKEQGNAAFKGFSRSTPKSQWVQTAEGAESLRSGPAVPGSLLLKIGDVATTGLVNMPAGFFDQAPRTLDPNKPEDLETIRKVEASYYDILNQLATADTEEAYSVAWSNWERLRIALERQLGIKLSDNVQAAWGEIEKLSQTESGAGLYDTGIHKEIVDKYLADRRKADQRSREDTAIKKDDEEFKFAKASGSAKDVKALIERYDAEDAKAGKSPDQYRSVLYGLKPSAANAAYFTRENFKKLYPYFTDAQLDKAISAYIDENGNYRSDIYQKLYANSIVKNEGDRFSFQMTTAQEAINAAKQKENEQYAVTTQQQIEAMRLGQGETGYVAQTGTAGPAEASGETAPAAQTGPTGPVPAQGRPTETVYKNGQSKVIDVADHDYWVNNQRWSTSPPSSSSVLPPQPPTPTETFKQAQAPAASPPPTPPAPPPATHAINDVNPANPAQRWNGSTWVTPPTGWSIGPDGKLKPPS